MHDWTQPGTAELICMCVHMNSRVSCVEHLDQDSRLGRFVSNLTVPSFLLITKLSHIFSPSFTRGDENSSMRTALCCCRDKRGQQTTNEMHRGSKLSSHKPSAFPACWRWLSGLSNLSYSLPEQAAHIFTGAGCVRTCSIGVLPRRAPQCPKQRNSRASPGNIS